MFKSLRERAASESGVSMPEALTVCMIIGILVGVGMPGFDCSDTRSSDAGTKAIARTAASAMEVYANDNLGAYDGATNTFLNQIDSNVPANMVVTAYANCSGGTGGDTCYVVRTPQNALSSNWFSLTKTKDGKLLSECSAHSLGGCPASGKWSAE